jgi:homocysteine S-methyltransferase
LFAGGIPCDACLEELNLSRPALVEKIHNEYRAAGAEMIETNTFGANAARLAKHGLEKQAPDINIAGVRLARAATGPDAIIAGAIGPLGEPRADARQIFAAQVEALANGGADCVILETFHDFDEVAAALAAAQSVCNLPVIAQVSPDESGNLNGGIGPDVFVPRLIALGASAIGCNCGAGPDAALAALRLMAPYATVPLTAQPSAGIPTETGGGLRWPCTPERMAQFARDLVHNGLRDAVRLIGGCCGTTPEHIRAMRAALEQHG